MAGKLLLDWSDDNAASRNPTRKNPTGPEGLAKAVVNSGNRKVGISFGTYASQASCPDGVNTSYRCPLYGDGCYAEENVFNGAGKQTKELNQAAGLKGHEAGTSSFTPEQIAEDEAAAIRAALPEWKKSRQNNWMRLHVVGDCVTKKAAQILSEAADECVASSPGGTKNIWTYTHAWRTVPRSAWSNNISMLGSCDVVEDIPKAYAKGYAPAIVMGDDFMRDAGAKQNRKFGKSFRLSNGFNIVPCPHEIAKIVAPDEEPQQCIDCKLCMKEDWLRSSKSVIAFAAHTKKSKVVVAKLITIDVEDTQEVEHNPCHSGAGRGSLQNSRYDRSPEAAKWMRVAKTSNSLAQLHKAWEWAGQNNIGGDVWVSGHSDGIIVTIGKRLRAKGKSFDDLMRFEKNPGGKWDDWSDWRGTGTIRVGSRVRVAMGSGLDSGKIGTVTGRGTLGHSGHKAWNVRYDDGTEDVMFDNRLYTQSHGSGRKPNPEDTAADMYETFHGKPSEEILEVGETVHFHENLAVLGELVEFKIATLTKKDAEISFADSGCMLCSNEHGTQLYVVGGDQSLDLKKLGFNDDQLDKDMITVGVLYELTYQTAKGFDKFKLTDYYHELGEETGFQPMVIYDRLNDFMLISGGEYKIKAEGITN